VRGWGKIVVFICKSSHILLVLYIFSLLEKEMDRLREELRLEKEKVIHFLFFAKNLSIVLQLLAKTMTLDLIVSLLSIKCMPCGKI
jgi:hypothetical protein